MHIFALHGFTGRGCDFHAIADFIGGAWHCPDLPGHGPNPLLDCSPEASIRFIEDEISRCIYPSTKSLKILLGYSMGARAAMQHVFTNHAAWDALVLVSPQPGIEDNLKLLARQESDAVLVEKIIRDGVPKFIEFWQQKALIQSQKKIPPEWRTVMQAAREEHTQKGLAMSLRQFGQGRCPNLWPRLKDLKLPTLLITGEQDTQYTKIAQNFASKVCLGYESGRFHRAIIKGAGHAPHLEFPEMTAKIIKDFIVNIN